MGKGAPITILPHVIKKQEDSEMDLNHHAFPLSDEDTQQVGLTKKEWMATVVLQGLLSGAPRILSSRDERDFICSLAVKLVDSLADAIDGIK